MSNSTRGCKPRNHQSARPYRDCLFDAPQERTVGEKSRGRIPYFLKHNQTLVTAGELSQRALADNYRTCAATIDHFGQARLLDDFRQADFADYRVVLTTRLTRSFGQ